MKLLIEDNQLLKKYLNSDAQWNETHYYAINCLEGILMNGNDIFITKELIYTIKNITLNIISSLYINDNKYYHTKVSNRYKIKIKFYDVDYKLNL